MVPKTSVVLACITCCWTLRVHSAMLGCIAAFNCCSKQGVSKYMYVHNLVDSNACLYDLHTSIIVCCHQHAVRCYCHWPASYKEPWTRLVRPLRQSVMTIVGWLMCGGSLPRGRGGQRSLACLLKSLRFVKDTARTYCVYDDPSVGGYV